MSTRVDEHGQVLDDQAECPKCGNTPSQMLGGARYTVRYRCTVDACRKRFLKEPERPRPPD